MTEMGELSVEDWLRDELRRVRHDLEHVTAERDGLRAQLSDAEEYISDLECALSGDAS